MAILTVRNLDDSVKAELRIVAAKHGHSMEEEARQILRRVLIGKSQDKGLGSRIHSRFARVGGVDLQLAPRSVPRPAPDFSDPQR